MRLRDAGGLLMSYSHFKGIPILIGDEVRVKVPGNPTKYNWATVETIVQEPKGMFEKAAPPPYLGLENGFEAFSTKAEAKEHGYETSRTGYVKEHRSQLSADAARVLAERLTMYANDLDDAAGICRCLGLDHRFDCPEMKKGPAPW